MTYPETGKISHTNFFIEGITNHLKIERTHNTLEGGEGGGERGGGIEGYT
jgi:hypothetical protein